MKRITEEDIEGSIPADAYAFMKHGKMEIDEKQGVSCGYCEHVAEGLKQAYKHYREEHKEVWEQKIKSFTSEKKVGNKLIRKIPLVDETPQEERHVIKQCTTNSDICLVEFDIRLKKKEEEEEIPEEVDSVIDLGRVDKKDMLDLTKTLRYWLKYAQKREKENKEATKEEMYSQNVGDSKLPNIIKKLLAEDAKKVIVSENKLGNFEVSYVKKKEEKKDDDTFKLDID